MLPGVKIFRESKLQSEKKQKQRNDQYGGNYIYYIGGIPLFCYFVEFMKKLLNLF